jgi:hypothetical protein
MNVILRVQVINPERIRLSPFQREMVAALERKKQTTTTVRIAVICEEWRPDVARVILFMLGGRKQEITFRDHRRKDGGYVGAYSFDDTTIPGPSDWGVSGGTPDETLDEVFSIAADAVK